MRLMSTSFLALLPVSIAIAPIAGPVVVRGSVADQAGKPIPTATVTVTVAATSFRASPTVDRDGRFTVSIARGAGIITADVAVKATGYSSTQISIDITPTTPDTLPVALRLLGGRSPSVSTHPLFDLGMARSVIAARDSAAVGVLVARNALDRQFTALSGADTSAMCVRVNLTRVGGTFARTIDSVFRAANGGHALSIPRAALANRSFRVTELTWARDTAWVTTEIVGGGLAIGEASWTESRRTPYVRSSGSWDRGSLSRITVSDGFLRDSVPPPPRPPKC
jgi:hypothetical protein